MRDSDTVTTGTPDAFLKPFCNLPCIRDHKPSLTCVFKRVFFAFASPRNNNIRLLPGGVNTFLPAHAGANRRGGKGWRGGEGGCA